MKNKDMISFFFGCLALLVFLITCGANAAEVECFSDEPKRYTFDLGAQTSGSYVVKVNHTSGKLKGIVHKFFLKDVSNFRASEDFLIKYNESGPKYTITYALYCKNVKKL